MNTGKFAAYKQVTTPNSDLSGVIAQQEQLQNRFKAKKDQKAEKEKNEIKARTEDIGRINSGAKTKYLNFEHSLQDAFRRKGGFIERYSNASARYAKDPSDTEAYGVMQNINQEVKRIALTKQTILGYDKLLSEGIANGTIDANMNKDFKAQLERLKSGQVNFAIDDYGNMKIENLAGLDFDNNGIADEITLESLSNQSNFGYFKGKFDLNSSNAEMKKRYGTLSISGQDPDGEKYDTKKRKGFDPSNSLTVKEDYKSMFGEDRTSLTSDGKSQLYQEGIDPNTISEEQYKGFLDSKVTEFQAMYNEEISKKSGEYEREKLKIEKQKAEQKANKKQNSSTIRPMTDKDGNLFKFDRKDGTKYNFFSIKIPNKDGTSDTSVKIGLKDKEVEVNKFTLNPSGTISYHGRKKVVTTLKKNSDGKPQEVISYEDVTGGSLNELESNLFAVKLGFNNISELIKESKRQINPESDNNLETINW
jgi:hypothetical protein